MMRSTPAFILICSVVLASACADDQQQCDIREAAVFCVSVTDAAQERVAPTSISFTAADEARQTLDTSEACADTTVECCVFNNEIPGTYEVEVLVDQIALTATFESMTGADGCHVETRQLELQMP